MPDALERLHTVIAGWQLRRVPVEDLPAAAIEALAHGLDSPALVQLAGMNSASWSELEPVVERVVAELDGPADLHAARVLVADAWLGSFATRPPSAVRFWLTDDLLRDLGADYAWVLRALDHLDMLQVADPEAFAAARLEFHQQPAEFLDRRRDEDR